MMAFLYPWATKEYLLWNMTIGQIIMYNNRGLNLRYPEMKATESGLLVKSVKELKQMRDDYRKQIEIENKNIENTKKDLTAKYGDIG